jgi:hypothetical protein
MRVLIVAEPRFQIPPEQLGQIIDGALQWYERYRDRFVEFGTFPGGGGFGVLEVADEETLNQMVLEMPFSPFSKLTIHPYVRGDAGFRQFQEAFAAMSGAR